MNKCCLNCGTIITKARTSTKFCCSSCSASYNGRNRTVTEEQKRKTSKALTERFEKSYLLNPKHCKVCLSPLSVKKRMCVFCSEECRKVLYPHSTKHTRQQKLRGWSGGNFLLNPNDVFSKNSKHSSGVVKKYFIEFSPLPYKCSICGVKDWNNKIISLQLDHIDGDGTNNSMDNLRLLCPNCHSQTDTYCRGNRNISTVSNDMLIEALNKEKNISEALRSVGLTPKGKNYDRAKRLKLLHTQQTKELNHESFKDHISLSSRRCEGKANHDETSSKDS